MTCYWLALPDGTVEIGERLGGDGGWSVGGLLLRLDEAKPLERIPTAAQLQALRTVLETEPGPRVLVEDVCEALGWDVPEPMSWRE